MELSNRIKKIKPSQTLAITAKANELKAKGIDIISFGAGEPDFDTPDFVKEAAIKALKEGKTKYTAAAGIPQLREAIAQKLKTRNNIDYSPSEVIVVPGAKMGLYEIFAILLNPGDEVIVPAPYWVSYTEQIALNDGESVIPQLSEENGFVLTADIVESSITPKTKALVLNTPSNPTGAVIPKKELEKIAEVCLKHSIMIISDECYEEFSYGEPHVSIASLSKEVREITFTVGAFSKSYSMTGWRLGWVAAPEKYIKAMTNIQSQTISNPTTFAQYGALEALKDNGQFPAMMRSEFMKRRDYIVEALNSIKGIKCTKPEGAFYAFPNVSYYIKGDIKNDIDLTTYLLEEGKVAVVPGSAFGKEGYIRLSYATSMENIKEGVERIKQALEKLG
ncbi:pyridoxal phosphate-dependent aminotransferase [Sulfurihydrogenibium azorense]|uniref:Aspartate aminotransferase n=1 Tax=Sulfurihydrogenibium azorense (strain DSM 15241 / OCM 825 / Az-Fu1) TaxID=204536 RepID=C1DT60_SULAA|nr:pyridoxal phosphate-dependent aminotransferase [Sulfurihydrogenibium azorense]ACN98959.1 aspartate aminotransferase [Sulfurihydrogenibium azorense Az-Fu1]MDM7273405.1 pyridoxal phosphate-dependent aminotransferase [Sulfurihydrogenibium azorense]